MSLAKKAASQLKVLRLHNKMGVEKFAAHIGVARQMVTRWESGAAKMTMKSFDEACSHLNVDPEKLICGSAEITLSLPSKD